MAQLTFGNIATNMSELQRFGYGSYYSDSSPVVTGLTPTVVTARDPVTGTTLTAVGTFNVFALESSIVTSFSSATRHERAPGRGARSPRMARQPSWATPIVR